MSRNKILAVLSGVLLIVIVAVYGRGPSFGFGDNWDRKNWPVEFQTNGERIYFTGTSSSGIQISANGGGMHMQMHGGGCVTCHGADRQGRRLMPNFWTVAPPLTAAALFKGHDDSLNEDGHGEHESYDDTSLQRAITKGVDPSGEQLDREMPRWTIAAQDIADLIGFLKSPVRTSNAPLQ
ncbi:MAG: c-type cytochrome [Rhodospirillaceae bacterium]|jgi:cytochrome c oxidase subunit II|nr:c-type cytochrome [Rhodospirillaceae bacterium]